MIVTRITAFVALIFFGFLCYLAIHGVTQLAPVVVTVFALVILIGGGNAMRVAQGRRRAPQYSSPSLRELRREQEETPATTPAPNPEPPSEGQGS